MSLNTDNAILSNAIKVDSSYNVGIGGSANASFKLQVAGAANITSDSSTTSRIRLTNTATGGNAWSISAGSFVGSAYGNSLFAIVDETAGNNLFVISKTGFVSMGTSVGTVNPSYNLQVAGTNTTLQVLDATGNASSVLLTSTNTSASISADYFTTAIPLVLRTGKTDRLTIAATGAATFSSSVTATKLILNTGATNSIYIGQNTGAGNYNNISLNGSTGEPPNIMGLSGGGVGDQALYISSPTGGAIFFRQGGNTTPGMTLTESGSLGINTTSPAFKLSVAQDLTMDSDVTSAQFIISGSSNAGKRLIMGYDTNSNGFGFIKCANQGVVWSPLVLQPNGGSVLIGTTTDSAKLTAIQSGSSNGAYIENNGGSGYGLQVNISSNSGSQFIMKARSTGVDRFIVRDDGNIAINTAASGSLGIVNSSTSTTTTSIYSEMGVNTNNTSSSHFVGAQSGFGNRIQIYGNGNIVNSNNSYGPISDIKLKENIIDSSPKLDKLMQVRIVNYNLIGDELTQIGVIAQELEQIFPGLVDEHIDRDKEGNDLGTTTKSVKMSVFTPMLIKAIQELKAEIDELKNK